MGKKSQADMIETIMVLVVVMILLVIALVFYFKSTASNVQETGAEVCQLSGEDLLVAVTAMPEIQCSIDTVTRDCIDIEKVEALQQLLKDKKVKDQYNNYISGTCPKKVSIELLYPVPEANSECQAGEEIGKCRKWTVFTPIKESKSKQMLSTPVSIYSDGMNYVGKLVVEVNK